MFKLAFLTSTLFVLPRLPTLRRGAHVRHSAAAEEDQATKLFADVVPKVERTNRCYELKIDQLSDDDDDWDCL